MRRSRISRNYRWGITLLHILFLLVASAVGALTARLSIARATPPRSRRACFNWEARRINSRDRSARPRNRRDRDENRRAFARVQQDIHRGANVMDTGYRTEAYTLAFLTTNGRTVGKSTSTNLIAGRRTELWAALRFRRPFAPSTTSRLASLSPLWALFRAHVQPHYALRRQIIPTAARGIVALFMAQTLLPLSRYVRGCEEYASLPPPDASRRAR